MKFCKDCKHARHDLSGLYFGDWECKAPEVRDHLIATSIEYRVTGALNMTRCMDARVTGAGCGPEAKFWEARE